MEKMVFALVTAARKLRQYFQSRQIVVLTDHLLMDILQRMNTSGKMVKWSMEVSEFSIEFRPRKAIKAQALADFITEFTFTTTAEASTEVTEEVPLVAGLPHIADVLMEIESNGPFVPTEQLQRTLAEQAYF